MKDFTFKAVLVAMAVSAVIQTGVGIISRNARTPSSVEDAYELSISTIALDGTSRIKGFNNVFLRMTFGKTNIVDLGTNEQWKVARGESKPLSIKLDLNKAWIQADDSMEFRLEVVENNLFKNVLVRCDQTAREISSYNRSYQCNIPGEQMPVLTYRLGRKGSTPQNMSVAQSE